MGAFRRERAAFPAGGEGKEEESLFEAGASTVVMRKNVRHSPAAAAYGQMRSSDELGASRECVPGKNALQPRNEEEQQGPPRAGAGAGKGDKQDLLRPPSGMAKHESLPGLHLNARCLKCDALGTIYCKGCEAHFCAMHDQKRHRFLLNKKKHEHSAVPGISYFRIRLPDDDRGGSADDSPLSDDYDSNSISNGGSGSEEQWVSSAPRNRRDLLRHEEVRSGARGGGGGGGKSSSVARRGIIVGSNRRLEEGGAGGQVEVRGPPRRRSRSTINLARSGWYNKIVMAIVRPPRCTYTAAELGNDLTPLSSSVTMKRWDFEVRNQRGLKLVCSQWRPAFTKDSSKLPCVVYLHGNSSARIDVVKTRSLALLGTAECTVVSFDFSGSGMSEGDWVTLGYFEQHDVADVLAYLRSNGMASRYLLWGRSMGAASALLYAARYPNSDLCGLILDSPFCSFRRLATDLVTAGQVKVPAFFLNAALGMLRRSVKKKTRCDLKTVAPIDRARYIRCPCLFIAARKDVMILPSHGADLSDAVGGPSLFITCKGSHNTVRPRVVLQAVETFVKGCFQASAVSISQAFSMIQTALAEAPAMAAAMRAAGTAASTAATSSSASSGRDREGCAVRARRPSGDGTDRGGGSGAAHARPPATPGPRLESDVEGTLRATRLKSALLDAGPPSSTNQTDSSGAIPSGSDFLRDLRERPRSKSNAGAEYQGRRSGRRSSDRRRGSGSRSGSGSGSGDGGGTVSGVPVPTMLERVTGSGMGSGGEECARVGVTKQRKWSAKQPRPTSANSGGTGIEHSGIVLMFPQKLKEHPYPHKRADQSARDDWKAVRGGTGELSPYTSPLPSAPERWHGGARAAVSIDPATSSVATAIARAAGGASSHPGIREVSEEELSMCLPPQPPPRSTGTCEAGDASRPAALATGTPSDGHSLIARDMPRSSGGIGSLARCQAARAAAETKTLSAPEKRFGGSGWLGRMRAKGAAMSVLRHKRLGSNGAPTVPDGGRNSRRKSPPSGGAPSEMLGCTCDHEPSACLCRVQGLPVTAMRERVRVRPGLLPMRTASGKLKM